MLSILFAPQCQGEAQGTDTEGGRAIGKGPGSIEDHSAAAAAAAAAGGGAANAVVRLGQTVEGHQDQQSKTRANAAVRLGQQRSALAFGAGLVQRVSDKTKTKT